MSSHTYNNRRHANYRIIMRCIEDILWDDVTAKAADISDWRTQQEAEENIDAAAERLKRDMCRYADEYARVTKAIVRIPQNPEETFWMTAPDGRYSPRNMDEMPEEPMRVRETSGMQKNSEVVRPQKRKLDVPLTLAITALLISIIVGVLR